MDIVSAVKDLLFNRREIVFAYLHGSFIEGDRFRDVDIAVYLDRDEGIDYELSLSVEMESLLRAPIDIKILNNAPLGFKYHATKGLLLFSKNDDLREDFVERTRDEYLDFKPVALMHLRETLHG